jgi:20S proteasome subunit beta 1
VRYFAEQHAREVGEDPSVQTVANLVQQINYGNKSNLMAAMIVAGWDRHGGAQVYSLPIGGAMVAAPWITDGSGSTYIWGFMDSEYRWSAAIAML